MPELTSEYAPLPADDLSCTLVLAQLVSEILRGVPRQANEPPQHLGGQVPAPERDPPPSGWND